MRWTVFFLAAASACADSSITGTVRDQFGYAIERVPVEARNTATNAKASATSAADGTYTIANLTPGEYELTISLPSMSGYKSPVKVADGVTHHDPKIIYNTQLGTLGEDFRSGVDEAARHKNVTGPAPTANGHPDFSGVWFRPTVTDPGKPEWLKPALSPDKSNQARCLPSNAQRYGPLFEIVQGNNYMVFINDDDSPGFYQVYLDGRSHPVDPNPQWNGHNVGKWEGDTLVVDRVGFDDRMWIDQGGHLNSGKLHIVSRYHRTDLGHLEITTTVEDPGALKGPYTNTQVADLAQGEMLYEFICAENERDVKHFAAN